VQLGLVLARSPGHAEFQFPAALGRAVGGRRALVTIALLWGAANLFVALVPGRDLASPLVNPEPAIALVG